MVELNQKALVARMSPTCRRTLEAAVGLCMTRSNYNIEIEHWLFKLLETGNCDFSQVIEYCNIDRARLVTDLTRILDTYRTGNPDTPRISPRILELAREAWLLASVEYGESIARSGHILAALVADSRLQKEAYEISSEFTHIDVPALLKNLPSITAETTESAEAGAIQSTEGATPGEPGAQRGQGLSKTPSLDQYTINLTERASSGQIDPVIGRDSEVRQIVDILSRRRQNNPILTGEAGVGKTAVVEGFALQVAQGDVPDSLKNVEIRALDIGLLQAGAGVRGEFENRLKSVIAEVKASPKPIIVFIDEAHTLIGAGGQAGQGDAANLLKPALARGELRTIAATTWAEYKQYFEGDAALSRRFQVVKVEEPPEDSAIRMVRGLVETLEQHHGVRILDEAVSEAVKLSMRYVAGRQLPDKAISLLDTACARVALSQSATPPQIDGHRRRIQFLEVELKKLARETASGADHSERVAGLIEQKSHAEQELETLEARWEQEKEMAETIRTLFTKLEDDRQAREEEETPDDDPRLISDEERESLKAELTKVFDGLKEIQGEDALIHVCVDAQAIADIVSSWTGIPVGRMVSDEIHAVLELQKRMEERVVGQSHALDMISQSIRTSYAKLKDPRTPIGVFMLAGPSGVGKTETAIALADLMYGGEQGMTVVNMSEYKEEHKVSLLMGPPPGYVGFGKGGVLTEAIRRRPYSVVLLDEFEKSHEGVQEIFYQVFDKGVLQDSEGRQVDFKNTVLILTTNAGTDLIAKLCDDPDTMPSIEKLTEALHTELLKTFKPAFLGRVKLIPYLPLEDTVLESIIRLKLNRIRDRIKENYHADLTYGDEIVEGIRLRCREVESGARNIDHILTRTLLPELSAEFLARMAKEEPISRVEISFSDDGQFEYHLS